MDVDRDRLVTTLAEIERDAVILACAISAGIHAALTPAHFAEGVGPGLGFLLAALLLGGLAALLTWRASAAALLATAVVIGGLLVSYALAVSSGVPVLHPHPEPVTGLALVTKAVEIGGLLAAVHLLSRSLPAIPVLHLRTKGRIS